MRILHWLPVCCSIAVVFVSSTASAQHPSAYRGLNELGACDAVPRDTLPPGQTLPPGRTLPDPPTNYDPTPPGDMFAFAPEGLLGASDRFASAPPMMGDYFGGAVSSGGGMRIQAIPTYGNQGILAARGGEDCAIDFTSPVGSAVGRLKLSENVSPVPRDRVFLNYNLFTNVPFYQSGPSSDFQFNGDVNVNRFTYGFEKTFLDEMMSFEFRLPFASTLDNNIYGDGSSSTNHLELGNMTLIQKTVLHATDDFAFTGGLAMVLPTADDVLVSITRGAQTLVRIENESVHLMPFLGALYTPNDRFFAQAVLQFDFDANGNSVQADPNLTGLVDVGTLNDQSFLFLDVAMGYWVHRSNTGMVRGIAPTLELHYNRSIQDPDLIRTGGAGSPLTMNIGGASQDIEMINMVLGTTFDLDDGSSLTLGYSVPLTGTDREFDGELRIMFNYWLR
ncbi:MAG: hypothetical protein O3A00_09190 [Planctomycetota bacterium]|nr:hypothetical protein [Planctomycetota bacterium]